MRSSTPAKAPWQRLLVHSTSLERMNKAQGTSSSSKTKKQQQRAKPAHRTSSSSTSSWGSWFTPPTRFVRNRSTSPTRKGLLLSQASRPSNLTLFLLRLNDNLPRYCELLADPSLKNAQAAAGVLDVTCLQGAAASSSPGSSSHSSGASSPSSFFRSSETLALEGEWETYASPLLLLTGAEALYGQMEVERLRPLYKTIQTELDIVKQRLCDPWLGGSTSSDAAQQQPLLTAQEAAISMSRTFQALQDILRIRCRLVEVQTRLFLSDEEPFDAKVSLLLQTCRQLLPVQDTPTTVASPMMNSVVKEIKAWIGLLETASHLEQCRFTETILAARRFKQHLTPSSDTALQVWFRTTLERLVSILPIYFDRIHAFASPLYGFETPPLGDEKYDAMILDFLRRHESKGGPSMAICLVVDAVRTSNLHFGRGLVMSHDTSSQPPLTLAEKERHEWQAVYMRTTIHHGGGISSSPISRSPSHGSGGGISTIMRRSLRASSKSHMDSFGNAIMRAASHDSTGSSMQGHHQVNMNVLEYPSETGPCSWPHTEWSRLVELIQDAPLPTSPVVLDNTKSCFDHQAVTHRQTEPTTTTTTKKSLIAAASHDHSLPPPSPPRNRPVSTSSFHRVRLSEYVWMFAIVKSEEDGKWHLRRTRGHTDEEIRAFLNDMAAKLTVSSLFAETTLKKNTPLLVDGSHSSSRPGNDLVRVWRQWDEANTQDFLRDLKRSFQLRPQSPFMESLYRGTSPRRRGKKRAVSHSESAIAFFVGTDFAFRQPQSE